MSLMSFDNNEYTTSSITNVPMPKAMKLKCKCKRNLEFDNNDDHNDHSDGEHTNKIQCLEENCVTRKNGVSNGNCDDWHPLNGTRYIELIPHTRENCIRSTTKKKRNEAGECLRCINEFHTCLNFCANEFSYWGGWGWEGEGLFS